MVTRTIKSVNVTEEQFERHWDAITPTKRSAHIRTRLDLADEAAEAVAALRELHDLQNGPPLIRDEARWREAMVKAEAVLRKLEPLIVEGEHGCES